MKEFTIDESLDFELTIHNSYSNLSSPDNPTDEDLIKILKRTHECVVVRNDDSPEFKSLRNQLEAEGYIKCERMWWNGDRVLKPFLLNGVLFDTDETFCCGAAMKFHLKFAREYQDNEN